MLNGGLYQIMFFLFLLFFFWFWFSGWLLGVGVWLDWDAVTGVNGYNPVMNRTKCKISYSCSPSLQAIINNHNKKILQKRKPKPPTKPCNCKNPANCPIPNKLCRTQSVIYKAQINNANYWGLSSGEIKSRIVSHRQTFREKNKEKSTALSSYIWAKNLNSCPTSAPGNYF